uniref:Uncharacterized protein n=1 Tax=Cannabis sativa TaxID=3483 RepID=A0A803NRG2_CANSA
MSTSICQGLQSCLEPASAEPKVLRLKLALPKPILAPSSPPKPNNSESTYHKQTDGNDNKNVGASGWNFLQALSNNNTKNDTKTDEKVYVHPMVKRSSAMLNAKSLQMCTEGLGSETGSDSGDSSGDEMSLLSSSPLSSAKTKKSGATQAAKRYCNRSCSSSFPPPLTSVSGSSGLQLVVKHQEEEQGLDGRERGIIGVGSLVAEEEEHQLRLRERKREDFRVSQNEIDRIFKLLR